MKITMYELLGMVKDGKAPKKIIAGDSETEYYFDKELKDYINLKIEEKLFEDELGKFLKYYINDEVEIIEEEPRNIEVCGSLFTKSEYDKLAHCEEEKKIPEKLELPSFIEFKTMTAAERYVVTAKEYDVLNDIIDYLKNKGE